MGAKLTLRIALSIAVAIGFALACVTATAQSNAARAKEHFERAMSYRAAGDPRAEEEFKQAIADRNGKYAEAWNGLAWYLADELRFEEAATAWRKYLKQSDKKAPRYELERLKRLDRGALLKSKSDKGQGLTIDEMLELITLVDGYGEEEDAIPYAEKAVELHPESGKLLVALARLIKNEQQNRALELLNRAIVFEPNNARFYVARGQYFFWVQGNAFSAEADFRQAIELSNGRDPSAWAGLGDSLARTGQKDEAMAAYRKYLSIRPKSAAHYDGEIEKSIKLLEDSYSSGSLSPLASQSTNNQENRTTGEGDEQAPCRRIKEPDGSNSTPLLCAPPMALRLDNSATESNIVNLRVLINEKGKAIVVQPISGNPALYDQAVKLIKEKRFKPRVWSGRKLKTEMVIRVVATPAESDAIKN